ncbi:MAG: alpha-L-fucosidase, partial [Saprospiraceae bacterium]|nr:alpha-L-fucosidase [Saprospiraceae bacterium]
MIKRFFCLALFSLPLLLSAQTPDYLHETDAQRDARMAWWKDARFGLFLHWGLYAVAAGEYGGQKNYGEWLMYEAKIPKPEYEKFAPQFNPVKFDADAWVRMAKDAGMKYIVITSKHHDGFCMFDSKVSDYDIADRTPFRRDPLRELADACRREGLKLCFYHSIMDWHHPDATAANFPRYREEYLKPQLRELLTNYGDLGVLWFDGEWIDEWTEPQGRDLYNFVRNLQPNIIVNNRVGKGRNGMQGMNNSEEAAGDFGTPEQEILGESSGLPWESCMTMNDHWGYNSHDKNYKSAADLIWNLADITAKGGNYLLNIGPTAEGTFPGESIERLRAIGEWTRRHAPAIYRTKPWHHWQEGENIRYAQGKSGEVYAFVRGLPASRKLVL